MQFVYNGQDKVTFAGKVDQEKKSGPKKITLVHIIYRHRILLSFLMEISMGILVHALFY